MKSACKKVLDNLPMLEVTMYARLDFVGVPVGATLSPLTDGDEINYLLIEAELIEPEIFVNICPEVSIELAKGIAKLHLLRSKERKEY